MKYLLNINNNVYAWGVIDYQDSKFNVVGKNTEKVVSIFEVLIHVETTWTRISKKAHLKTSSLHCYEPNKKLSHMTVDLGE